MLINKNNFSVFNVLVNEFNTAYLCAKDMELLPPHILQSQTLDYFGRHLKTYYFQSVYPAP